MDFVLLHEVSARVDGRLVPLGERQHRLFAAVLLLAGCSSGAGGRSANSENAVSNISSVRSSSSGIRIARTTIPSGGSGRGGSVG